MVREIFHLYLVFIACLNLAFLLTCILLDFSFLLASPLKLMWAYP
jgi:hypothetical protein